MLPKTNRLSKTKDINKVLRFGRKFNTKSFTISVSQPQISNSVTANFGKPNAKITSMYDASGAFIGNQDTPYPLKSQSRFKGENAATPPYSADPTTQSGMRGQGVSGTAGKLCIIVSTKYGKANKRNLLRRRIRAITRKFILSHDYSVIFQVKKGITPIEFEQVETEIMEILSKL